MAVVAVIWGPFMLIKKVWTSNLYERLNVIYQFHKKITKPNDIYDKLHPLNWIRIKGISTYHSVFERIPQTTWSHGFVSERRWHRCTLTTKQSLDCTCGVGHPYKMTSLLAHFMRSKKNKYGLPLTSSSRPHIRPEVSAGTDSFFGSPYLSAVKKGCQLDLQLDHWVHSFGLQIYTLIN